MPEPTGLQIYGFLLIGIAATVFAVLDGFALGIGMMLPFCRRAEDRPVMVHAIWPLWEGNQLWALIAGGALFALFPGAFAVLLSLLYPVVVLLMVALLLRPVAFEIWHHSDAAGRRPWEWAFLFTSVTITTVFGAVYGLTLSGLPFTADDRYSASLKSVLNPVPLLTAALFLSAFLMHGGAYLVARAAGAVQATGRRVLGRAWMVFAITFACWFAAVMGARQAWARPLPWVLAAASAGLLLALRRSAGRGERAPVFLSGLVIASVFPIVGVLQFPVVLANSRDFAGSITLADASPAYTLRLLAGIATVMLLIVGAFTIFVYRIFRHKVAAEEHAY